MKRTKVAIMVHKSAVARMWTDIGILGCDAAGAFGLLLEQKLTAVIRMLMYGSSADHVDEIARMGKSTMLEALVTASTRGGPRLSNPFRIPDPRSKDYFLPIKNDIGKMSKGVLASSKLNG
ncbi:unnamed protein product [Prunus armeniaca]